MVKQMGKEKVYSPKIGTLETGPAETTNYDWERAERNLNIIRGYLNDMFEYQFKEAGSLTDWDQARRREHVQKFRHKDFTNFWAGHNYAAGIHPVGQNGVSPMVTMYKGYKTEVLGWELLASPTDDHVIGLIKESLQRPGGDALGGGATLFFTRVIIYTIRDGKMAEHMTLHWDQDVLDAMWNLAPLKSREDYE
jgi:hypothetical protein